jgi:prepilin-type N-terminal cleavage/methylation domain-containing protein
MLKNFQFSIFNFQQKSAEKQRGFTIVEVLVTSFIFSIIAITVSGLFIQTLTIERRTFASDKIQENGLYIMELMSREIRVSQILDSAQSPAGDSNCTLTSLKIQHPVNGTVTYSLSNGILQRTAQGVVTDISSSDIAFSRLNFCVAGSNPTDGKQARVAILASIQNKTGKEILTTNLETAVSSRDVTTEF